MRACQSCIGRAWVEQVHDERFLTEILARVHTLRDHPEMGRIVPEFDQPTLRELIHPPFGIVYRLEKPRLYIVRVWRSERLLRLSRDEVDRR